MTFLRAIRIAAERGPYPLNLDTVLSLTDMRLNAPVTLLIGENGSGKSTLLEALACALSLPAIGSADVSQDATLTALQPLAAAMRLSFVRKPARGFFLRAEDFFGFTRRIASMQEDLRDELTRVEEEYADRSAFTRGQARSAYASSLAALEDAYGADPDARSHGESFLHLFAQRIRPGGLYLMDEPEAPLSPLRQLSLLSLLMERAEDSQFIIATHSPILMAYPGAEIYCFDQVPVSPVAYRDIEQVSLMRDFLNAPERYLSRLR